MNSESPTPEETATPEAVAELYPDIDHIQSVVLREGPRSRKVAKYSTIHSRHTGAVHHDALSIQTYRKQQGQWKYSKEHSISLSSEGEDEIAKLAEFLNAVRSQNAPHNTAHRLAVESASEGEAEAVQYLVEGLSQRGKAEALAALQQDKYQAALAELKTLLGASETAEQLRQLFAANLWLLGRAGSTVREAGDFLLCHHADGSRELLAIEAMTLPLFERDETLFYPSAALSKIVARLQSALAKAEGEGGAVRGRIIIGREGDAEQQAALRAFNRSLRGLAVQTFDGVLHAARRVAG